MTMLSQDPAACLAASQDPGPAAVCPPVSLHHHHRAPQGDPETATWTWTTDSGRDSVKANAARAAEAEAEGVTAASTALHLLAGQPSALSLSMQAGPSAVSTCEGGVDLTLI